MEFPHYITSVNGKHTEIIASGMESQCYDYNGTNSIVLLVVAVEVIARKIGQMFV